MFKKPEEQFHSERYLEHNKKRLEHLESLNIDFKGKAVLEVGAGIGDHTEFLLTRGCSHIYVTEGRSENLDFLEKRYKNEKRVTVSALNLESPTDLDMGFDIIYCYGVLYHLSDPESVLKFLEKYTNGVFLLETCVSYNNKENINVCDENAEMFSQSVSGKGCRPGREWLFLELKKLFQYVYVPTTQPDHFEFPSNWDMETVPNNLSRAIFIASKFVIGNELLCDYLPSHQKNLNYG